MLEEESFRRVTALPFQGSEDREAQWKAIGSAKGIIGYGHGWFRTSDLSRVKRALSR